MPWVAFGSALFHTAISLVVLLLAQLILNQHVPITAVFFPVVLLPLVFGIMGLAWFLAAVGVYLRDISQVTGMFTTVMLFISAVFFPITSLPDRYQFWLHLNPLAVVIEKSRGVLIFGQMPSFISWALILGLGILMAWAGFAWFQMMRKGFADVL